ncbi:MAG: hypothetical protein H0W20_07670 [Chthoniobacterales bacterium]|nr:hypothetical protein [Chthoniobacterales bacterium]
MINEIVFVVVGMLKKKGVASDLAVTETPVCHLAVVLDPDGSKVLIHKRKAR